MEPESTGSEIDDPKVISSDFGEFSNISGIVTFTISRKRRVRPTENLFFDIFK